MRFLDEALQFDDDRHNGLNRRFARHLRKNLAFGCCCGGVFCDSCSSRRTAVPGWGFEDEVRVCDECHTLERKQMPMLLAGNVFVKPGDWTGSRNKRFVRLSHDQSALVWSPWRDDEGADEENLKTADIRKVMCVSLNKSNRSMVITLTPHATRNK